ELYKQFKNAPVLGSLINPKVSFGKGTLFELKWEEVGPLIAKALAGETDDEKSEMGVVVKGLSRAANILAEKFQCIFTNPPFLGLERQNAILESYVKKNFPFAKRELALCMFERIQLLLSTNGTSNLVLPGEWTFVRSNRKFREKLLRTSSLCSIARLGANSFVTGIRANPILLISSRGHSNARTVSIDISHHALPEKPAMLARSDLTISFQKEWEEQVDCRFLNSSNDDAEGDNEKEIARFCDARNGMSAGDGARFESVFWEVNQFGITWDFLQSSTSATQPFGGREKIIRWEQESGEMADLAESVKHLNHAAQNWRRGKPLWGKWGVVVNQIGAITTIYTGEKYDGSCFAITPNNDEDVLPIVTYALSGTLKSDLKKIDPTWNLKSPKTLLQLKLNLDSWRATGEQEYPNGLPKPFSNDPTQWVFHGHPCGSVIWDEEKKWTAHGLLRTYSTVLQVAVARLLGYRWPAELDADMGLADEQREWVKRCKELLPFAYGDGIVCIPPVRGEQPADERLLGLLAAAFRDEWNNDVLSELLASADHAGKTLETWLRDKFFAQHCKLFHHRPFIWHIWDGRRRDGFHALVNYHKLAEENGRGRQLLENLTYSYLGDWITRQKEGVKRGEGGAEDRLAAALELQKRLIAIIEGEPPFDIFVRWQPIEDQPIGWEPDINDGVRLNIRPFMAQDIPGGRKGAGVLRWKPNIKWNKDRGKEPYRPQEQYPWFWKNSEFTGDRVNNIHLSNERKRQARERMKAEG
ncbi:MAG: SAM-dependent DNA methyltransferase, partial [Deltaproteobacteria bacterium]|nr:SAM-dependent DNA methyltransferase [Deltaproteobacteria bacterium]